MNIEIWFLNSSNLAMNFPELRIILTIYVSIKVILTTKQVKKIEQKMFAISAFELKKKIYIIYTVMLTCQKLHIQLSWQTQVWTL